MNRSKITGKIVDIQSYEDEGYIFEQNVFLEMSEGTILRIFDPDILIKKEMMGKTKQLTLTAFLPQVQKSSEQKDALWSDISLLNNEKSLPMHFEGKIEEFNEKRDRFILNFGIGSIEVDVHAFQVEDFNVEDFVKFDVYRIDLNVLYPDNQT